MKHGDAPARTFFTCISGVSVLEGEPQRQPGRGDVDEVVHRTRRGFRVLPNLFPQPAQIEPQGGKAVDDCAQGMAESTRAWHFDQAALLVLELPRCFIHFGAVGVRLAQQVPRAGPAGLVQPLDEGIVDLQVVVPAGFEQACHLPKDRLRVTPLVHPKGWE